MSDECFIAKEIGKRIARKEVGLDLGDILIDVKPIRAMAVIKTIILNEGGIVSREVELDEEFIKKLITKLILLVAGGRCRGCAPDPKGARCLLKILGASGAV